MLRQEKMSFKMLYVTLIMGLFVTGVSSCASSGASGVHHFGSKGQNLQSEKKVPPEAGVFVDDLLENPPSGSDQEILVRGAFMGWQGSCHYPPPETRSDFMLEHNGKCIYVSGPLPRELAGKRKVPKIGQEIAVKGTIRFDKKKRPYLKSRGASEKIIEK